MPTHLVYQAWKNTDKVIQRTKDSKGNEIVREIEFVDPMKHKDLKEHHGNCFLCGEKMSHGIHVSKLFSNVFTDWNSGKSRKSQFVCPACSFTILTSPKRHALRNFSHVANHEKLLLPNREELRELILNPPDPPFVINIAVSQKKHICFKSQVNYSQNIFAVMYEEMPVLINKDEFEKLLRLVEHFMYGFTKSEILTGEYNQKKVLDFGIEKWEAFENMVKQYRGNPLLDVVMFVAQKIDSEEELKCYMASELKINTQQQQPSSSMRSTEAETGIEARADRICGDKSSASQKSAQSEQLQLELF